MYFKSNSTHLPLLNKKFFEAFLHSNFFQRETTFSIIKIIVSFMSNTKLFLKYKNVQIFVKFNICSFKDQS